MSTKKAYFLYQFRITNHYTTQYATLPVHPFSGRMNDQISSIFRWILQIWGGETIVYIEKDVLTPSQAWDQKVLDVFLKLHSHGYGANVLWFESLTVRGHEIFYLHLYRLWNITLGLTSTDKERIVPGHNCGRTPLFRWEPAVITSRSQELKWWRKQSLGLMNAFLTRAKEKEVRGCGALYILTALAQTHPGAAEVFPWLVGA